MHRIDVILIMQRSPGYARPAQAGRSARFAVVKFAGEREFSRAPDINDDAVHCDRTFLRRIFIGDVSARIFRSRRKIAAPRCVINFDDGTVNVIMQAAA